ncbi:MAG: hypothetical protein GY903_14815 [Fuerstiella sp.]|nr:hypothetical protein [Fuerstiella sp.]MCP4855757.1 hypothetical protein [Fuerstiella sp.]
MKRSTLLSIVTLAMAFSTANTAQACCLPYILNPFAWFGCYGCGYGGNGYGGYGGHGGYGYGAYQSSYGGGYVPQAPIMNYPAATPGCNCTSALPQQQALTAVQVPITTYRAVTQYVPQTTYRTQYRQAAPLPYQNTPVAYAPSYGGALSYPAASYYNTTPAPAPIVYNQAPAPVNSAPTVYGSPTGSPTIYQPTPNVATPHPAGDIAGDHEYPTQGMAAPIIPNAGYGAVPIRRVSYGVTPRSPQRYSNVVQ